MPTSNNMPKIDDRKIRIYEAKIEDADLVMLLVFNLLKELGRKLSGEDEKAMFRTCHEILEEDNLSKALLALDEHNVPVSVMTLAEAHALSSYGRFGIIMEHYVEPEYRSHGVGTKMVEAAMDLGRKLGWNYIQVAAPDGEMAQRTKNFYARHNFKDVGQNFQLSLQENL